MSAQEPVYETVVRELRAGEKRTHWMWYIFPQLRSLGRSSTALFFGLRSLDEARAYLAHPQLGPKLVDCVSAVLALHGRSLRAIFGSPDDMKFRSSMTLFAVASKPADISAVESLVPTTPAAASPAPKNVFIEALERYCDGRPDDRTLALLAPAANRAD